jgi:hypothetical protein
MVEIVVSLSSNSKIKYMSGVRNNLWRSAPHKTVVVQLYKRYPPFSTPSNNLIIGSHPYKVVRTASSLLARQRRTDTTVQAHPNPLAKLVLLPSFFLLLLVTSR